MDTFVSDQLKKIFNNLFFIDPQNIHPKLNRDDVLAWDSLQHLNLVLAIEEEFGVSISPEESNEMLNFGLIVLLIDEKLKEKSKADVRK